VEGATVKVGEKTCKLPIEQADRFEVYRKSTLPVAAGETVRITKNGRPRIGGKETRFDNGTIYQVAGFTEKGDLRLSNGLTLPKDYGHIAYGYTSTSNSAQSKSVKHVFASTASTLEQFYVAMSRGIDSIRVYTDDKQALLDSVKKSGARMSATDLLGQPKSEKKVVPFMEALRSRQAYQAIKDRAQEAIKRFTPNREIGHERKRA